MSALTCRCGWSIAPSRAEKAEFRARRMARSFAEWSPLGPAVVPVISMTSELSVAVLDAAWAATRRRWTRRCP